MSVFGLDLGTLNSVMAVTRRGGVDIVCNEVSKRETATFVSMDNERHIGESGFDRAVRNVSQTIAGLKRFIGAMASGEQTEKDLRFLNCNVTEDSNGRLQFELFYNGEQTTFYPEQVAAMFFSKIRKYVEKETATIAKDCVIAVPCWYTTEQRRLILQACEIAQINCMSLINEATAASLDYGIFKSASFPEKEDEGPIVAVCDLGYAATTVTISQFWKGNMRVIATECSRNVGTREIDYALCQHFGNMILEKYKVDVLGNKKARLRLLQACDKVKCMLSGLSTAPLNIENLMDIDVNIAGFQREEMEATIQPLLGEITQLCKSALASSGIPLERLSSVELIGGGCRIPSFKAAVSAGFNNLPPSFTLNASESIARGCAVTAAVFSPKFQVREFVVNEVALHTVCLGYHSTTAQTTSSVSFLPNVNKVVKLLKKGDHYPKVVELTFERTDAFTLYSFYDEEQEGIAAATNGRLLIGEWEVGSTTKPTTGDVKVRIRFAASGLMAIEAASAVEEYEVEETEEKKAEKEGEPAEKVTVTKKKQRKVELTLTPKAVQGHPAEFIVKAIKLESTMDAHDTELQRTREVKNELEGYIYEFRGKLGEGGNLEQYVTKDNQTVFLNKCNVFEDWLYNDGFESTLNEYQTRLDELKQIGSGAHRRFLLADELPFAQKKFADKLKVLKDIAKGKIGTAAHISEEELTGAMKKCDDAVEWSTAEMAKYDASPKYDEPTLTVGAFDTKFKEVEVAVKAVVNKPAPKVSPPPAPEKKDDEKPAEETKPTEEGSAAPEAQADAAPEEAAPTAQPMDLD